VTAGSCGLADTTGAGVASTAGRGACLLAAVVAASREEVKLVLSERRGLGTRNVLSSARPPAEGDWGPLPADALSRVIGELSDRCAGPSGDT